MKNKKRICLFAAYDKNNYIHDYVVYYLQELSKFADIYYLAECSMTDSELEKIKPYTIERYAYSHGKYDFGSWQELIYKIGWDKLSEYDELILANDSCFAPLFPLNDLFEKAEKSNCDFYGISEGHRENLHIQSYFMVLNKKCFTSEPFIDLISSLDSTADKRDIVEKYEGVLTKILQNEGFVCKKLLKGTLDVYGKYITLLKSGCPFLKKLAFTETDKYSSHESLVNWEKHFLKYTNYNIELIKKYLIKEGFSENYFKSKEYKKAALKYNIDAFGKWIFDVRFSKKRNLIRILGITFLDKYKCSIPSFN